MRRTYRTCDSCGTNIGRRDPLYILRLETVRTVDAKGCLMESADASDRPTITKDLCGYCAEQVRNAADREGVRLRQRDRAMAGRT